MRRFWTVMLMFLSGIGVPTAAQQPEAASPPRSNDANVELTISGPRVIRAGEDLRFRAFIVNRSSDVIAIPSPTYPYGCGLGWTITDRSGRTLPMRLGTPYCPLRELPPIRDGDFILVQPGQRVELKEIGDPSNCFLFPGRGFYRVSLRFVFDRPSRKLATFGTNGRFPRTSVSEQSLETLLQAPAIDASSAPWTLYLTN
jgi:hypothetical protein